MVKYRLEITMESRASRVLKHIRRSFPVVKGVIDISKYGYPYDRYGSVEIVDILENQNDTSLELKFDGEELSVFLNSFSTAKREYQTNDPDNNVPRIEVLHTTFYLFIE